MIASAMAAQISTLNIAKLARLPKGMGRIYTRLPIEHSWPLR
ncbi:MAG: hypothetical protein ACREP6_05215 [Candidatus Binataceae bacterium]